jgi:hypothetical protein
MACPLDLKRDDAQRWNLCWNKHQTWTSMVKRMGTALYEALRQRILPLLPSRGLGPSLRHPCASGEG